MLFFMAISFLAGALVTLVIQAYLYIKYFWLLPKTKPEKVDSWMVTQLDKSILKLLENNQAPEFETCSWFNLFMAYLFREWRDTDTVRRIFLQKIRAEFEELLQTAAGKIITGITINGYSLGPSLPIIKKVSIVKTSSKENNNQMPDEVDFALDIDYRGGFQLATDVDLIFGKSAYVSVKVVSLRGKVRVEFTRYPFSHWSFSFYKEPEIQFQAESLFENRKLPQLASLLTNQLRRSLRKKHTLPYAVNRRKPFLPRLDNEDDRTDVNYIYEVEIYMHDLRLSCGHLVVKVVGCSRISPVAKATSVYCLLSLGSSPMDVKIGHLHALWAAYEVSVEKDDSTSFGVTFKECFDARRSSRASQKAVVVIVESIVRNSPADHANMKKGDIIVAIDGQEYVSIKKVVKHIRGKSKFVVKFQRKEFRPLGNCQLNDIISDTPGDSSVERDSAKLAAAVSQNELSLDDDVQVEKDRVVSDNIDLDYGMIHLSDDIGGDCTSRTSAVSITSDPMWGEEFNFVIEREHKYLNASIWYRLDEKSTFDLMMGYVSVPLMNISVAALGLPQNTCRNVYILKPADLFRVDSSLSSVRLSSVVSHKGINHEWCGDITLEFTHEMLFSRPVEVEAGL